MSGPINYNENKLRNPPTPKSKQKLVCNTYEVIEEKPGTCIRGYLEVLVKPRIISLGDMFTPGTIPLFWLAQQTKHSCVIYDDRLFALMGTRANTKVEKDDNTNTKRTTVSKTLSLLEVNFAKDSEEFLRDGVSDAVLE